jgi:Rad3-related DNA helicase
MQNLESEVEEAKYNHDTAYLVRMAKKLDGYDKFVCKINRFVTYDDLRDWLCHTVPPERAGADPEIRIQPLTATLFADEILFKKGGHKLIMSATILHFPTFMRCLGIDPSKATTLACPSEFPVENRRIYYKPVGSMSWEKKADTLPKMLVMVEKILDKFGDVKGIVNTHTYDIARALTQHLRSTKHKNRIITHTSAPGSRDIALQDHTESKLPTVIISPSMKEGVDLKEDLGRFGITMKVPFPQLNNYVKARMARDNDWYTYNTILPLIQFTGRIVRTKTDKGINFILDRDFESLMRRGGSMIPEYWSDALC